MVWQFYFLNVIKEIPLDSKNGWKTFSTIIFDLIWKITDMFIGEEVADPKILISLLFVVAVVVRWQQDKYK